MGDFITLIYYTPPFPPPSRRGGAEDTEMDDCIVYTTGSFIRDTCTPLCLLPHQEIPLAFSGQVHTSCCITTWSRDSFEAILYTGSHFHILAPIFIYWHPLYTSTHFYILGPILIHWHPFLYIGTHFYILYWHPFYNIGTHFYILTPILIYSNPFYILYWHSFLYIVLATIFIYWHPFFYFVLAPIL